MLDAVHEPRAGVSAANPHRRPLEEVAAALRTDPERGLTDAEAAGRLARYGRNELTGAAPPRAWMRFLAQFADPLVVLLLVATTVSAALWAYERDADLPYEAIAILAVVLLNATVGFAQQARAEAAVAALRAMTAATAAVVRGGRRRSIPAADIVPGDVMLLEEGDTVPADGRLLDSTALQTAEAALTGESLPVHKDAAIVVGDVALGDRRNMVFSGTAATYGHGRAVVTATGMHTEMGRIAGLLEGTADEPTPLQRELARTGRRLGLMVIVIAAVMIATIVVVEDVRGLAAILDVLILGVALAVAAVPEGLPAVVTAVLAIGVQRMARRHAIVRHLAAVEALGSATVIASDKTGTLTRNEMTVRVAVTAGGRVTFTGSGYAPDGEVAGGDGRPLDAVRRAELERLLVAAQRANNATLDSRDGRWVVLGDPTEGALLVAAAKAGLRRETLDARLPRLSERPFSSDRKIMSTVHRDTAGGNRPVLFAKGAPDVVLARCSRELVGLEARPLTPERRSAILRGSDMLANEALRTLGIASRELPEGGHEGHAERRGDDLEQDLVFAGLVGMFDPPRPEAREAVARARRAGIRPLVITGDHPRTASVVARELGIADDEEAVTGPELEAMSDEARAATVARVAVYARVSPEHKLRIVEALRRTGAVVAMTGDGVNDAPALRKADIGVAMGITGTDVSKEAADIVLADDNFATIVAAVEEGRAIFVNIQKFLRYLLSSNFGEVLTMFFGVLFADRLGLQAQAGGLVLPLVATQILWINLVTDGPPALALGVDPAGGDVMQRPPRPAGEGVLTGPMWRGIILIGLVMAAATLFVLDSALPSGLIEGDGSLRYAQTMAFTTLMLCQIVNVVNARSDTASAVAGLFTNGWLWTAMAGSVALQAAVVYVPPLQQAFGTVPLGAADWLRCVAAASAVLWVREIDKLFARRRSARD
jgi:Ca2+-transporting ATPase